MPNLKLRKKEKLSSFRKIAIGTWSTAYDPTVYGQVKLPADKAVAYLEEFRPQTFPKNSLEARERVVVTARTPEQGQGLVLEIPKVGEKAKPATGSEPPPPPADLKGRIAMPTATPSTSAGAMDLDEKDSAGGGSQ